MTVADSALGRLRRRGTLVLVSGVFATTPEAIAHARARPGARGAAPGPSAAAVPACLLR
ncbi:hypothetical protein ABTX81_31705 [Kitasatospora sp. NPDC097605]|uniref:hypothetical protein n=1 Tax=Kitasatospora sp. NPDC097605 TaxID=3157226 RepID=UPI00331A2A80